MPECTNCGRTLSDAARFCRDCGTPVPAATAEVAPAVPADSAKAALQTPATPEPAGPPPTEDPAVLAPTAPTAEETAVLAPVPPPAENATVLATTAVAPEVAAPEAAHAGAGQDAAASVVSCPKCGASVPAGDLFCGDCGSPMATPAAAPSATDHATTVPPLVSSPPPAEAYQQPAAPHPAAAPVAPAAAAFAAPPAVVPAYTSAARPAAGPTLAEYLSFEALFTETSAIAVFWIAEGANLVYWILHWINYRYGGAEAFFWSAVGFVLFAVVIRVLVEAAVGAARLRGDLTSQRRDLS